jgi:hypothetical protein
MASCTTIQEFLEDYLQGRLSPERIQLVDDHLHRCAVCRQSLEVERLLLTGIRTYPILDPPSDLADAVLNRLMPSSLMVGITATLATIIREVLRQTQRLIEQRVTFTCHVVRARWEFAQAVIEMRCTDLKMVFTGVSTLIYGR